MTQNFSFMCSPIYSHLYAMVVIFQMFRKLLNDRFGLFQMILEQKLLKEITEDKFWLCITIRTV